MAVIELSLVPIGTKSTGVSQYIAKAHNAVKDLEGIKIQLNPMGTVLKGDIDDCLKAARLMQEAVFEEGIQRVYSVLKIDDRRDKKASLEQKIQSVEEKLK